MKHGIVLTLTTLTLIACQKPVSNPATTPEETANPAMTATLEAIDAGTLTRVSTCECCCPGGCDDGTLDCIEPALWQCVSVEQMKEAVRRDYAPEECPPDAGCAMESYYRLCHVDPLPEEDVEP